MLCIKNGKRFHGFLRKYFFQSDAKSMKPAGFGGFFRPIYSIGTLYPSVLFTRSARYIPSSRNRSAGDKPAIAAHS